MKEIEALYPALNGITLSQREAEKVVGGRNRLFKLVSDGSIRAEKKTNHQHGRWYCNLYDCVKFAKKYV